tara:strand:- start:155426 stop:155962 length:537 start_codon:yes stop_codon:yes gene_type:complete
MASLQDQLLRAGVVDKKKAGKIKKEKRKQAKSQPKGQAITDETREQAQRARQEKVARDRLLNQQRQSQAQEKAIQAQVIQLITMNRIERRGGEVAYQFTDGSKIKKLYVTAQLQNDLSRGRVAIARLNDGYELLPAAAAEKIRQRDEQAIVLLVSRDQEIVDEDDPYADYQIPDDLMW